MKINIVGGGAGGLYLALLMKKRNPAHNITVSERDGPNDTFGWGIVFSQRTIDLLQESDEPTWREVVNAASSWEHTLAVHKGETIPVLGNRFYGIRRLTLLQILHQRCRGLGVDLHFHENITEPSQLEEWAANADLLVGADGANSFVRRTYQDFFLPSIDLRQNKYVWLGTHQLFGGLTLMFRQTDVGLFIAHAYTFDRDTSTFIVECPPDTWDCSGLARMSEEETVRYLADVFKEESGGYELLSNNFLRWSNFSLIKSKRWSYKNMVLVGDAAHTVHFSIGSGTKLALEDAVALTKAFDKYQAVALALQAYERVQKPRIDQFQDAAVHSLDWLENVEEHLHLDPVPFAYALVTRSHRVGYNRLKREAPKFIQQYNEWRHVQPLSGPVPLEFLDLFQKVAFGHLATLMSDGTPQVSPVWVDYDGECLLINSAKGRQKDLNMERQRDVAIEIPDPDNPNRYLAIRGRVVEITEEGADEHLDRLARRYLVRDNYPPTWKFPGEVRRIYKIAPKHVTAWEPFG